MSLVCLPIRVDVPVLACLAHPRRRHTLGGLMAEFVDVFVQGGGFLARV